MSLKQYCSNCGLATEYTLEKPNFCSKCGKSFNVNVANINISRNVSQLTVPSEEDKEDALDKIPNHVPHVEDMGFQVIVDNQSRGVKIEDIIATIDPTTIQRKKADPPPKGRRKKYVSDRSKILADFQREAGPTNRNNAPIIGE